MNYQELTNFKPEWNILDMELLIKQKQRIEDKSFYIYYLMYDRIIVYIGQTVNVLNRSCAHYGQKIFNNIRYFETTSKNVNELEKLCIKKYNPFYNGTHVIKEEQRNLICVRDGYFIRYRNGDGYYDIAKNFFKKSKIRFGISYNNSGYPELYFNKNNESNELKILEDKYVKSYLKINSKLPNYLIKEPNLI